MSLQRERRGEDTNMYTCNHCGGFVTRDFARVFGSNDDQVYACPACTTFQAISQGGVAARPGESVTG